MRCGELSPLVAATSNDTTDTTEREDTADTADTATARDAGNRDTTNTDSEPEETVGNKKELKEDSTPLARLFDALNHSLLKVSAVLCLHNYIHMYVCVCSGRSCPPLTNCHRQTGSPRSCWTWLKSSLPTPLSTTPSRRLSPSSMTRSHSS